MEGNESKEEKKFEQDEIDKERGFTEDELKTCIKVLDSFKQNNRIESLSDKRYKALRTAGIIFIDSVGKRLFHGMTPDEYHKNKTRKYEFLISITARIERKKRKKLTEEEDAKRIAKTKMREKKLRKLEELTESSTEAKALLIENGKTITPLLLTDNIPTAPDVIVDEAMQEDMKREESDEEKTLHYERECYICHVNFMELHHFYDKMCPKCAALNWEKRNQKCDLTGKVALVTGARVKIGYEITLILLRNGASVIATSRFPNDTALRFAKEKDFENWKSRLHIYGLDLRYIKDVETFCDLILKNYTRLDMIINNAAQTIRRPPAFYSHLIPVESMTISQLPEGVREIVKLQHPAGEDMKSKEEPKLLSQFVPSVQLLEDNSTNSNSGKQELTNVSTVISTAALSQIPLTAEDHVNDPSLFPPGVVDEHQQQLDLRTKNSWVLEHDQVNPIELAEVHVINSISPYVINSRLLGLMRATPASEKFIINVSSVEGMFFHKKTTKHPHTNMAKASLNMMTRTSAPYFARYHIWMNSVDTGWISDMNPVSRSKTIAKKYKEFFRNPLDEVDGAARVLDPIFARLQGGPVVFGRMIKDYHVVPW